LLCSVGSFCLLWGAASASAHSDYTFTGSFGASGTGAGQLSLVEEGLSEQEQQEQRFGVAVNEETHDVYITDTGNNRVDEFEADGTFVRAWGWGVATGAAEPQTCTTTTTSCQQGLSGLAPGEFEAPVSIAVDNSPGGDGDVYVADKGRIVASGESTDHFVSKFDAEGKLIESWGVKGQLDGSNAPTGDFGLIEGLAVDASGNLWMSVRADEKINSAMYEFGQDGNYVQSWLLEGRSEEEYPGSEVGSGITPLPGLAIDGSGDLYVNGFADIKRYTAAGNEVGYGAYFLETFNLNQEYEEVKGIAADPATDDIYVNVDGLVERFASSCEAVEASCSPLESFGPPQSVGSVGLAVDSSTGAAYVLEPGSDQVEVFAPEVPRPPTLEAEAVAAVTSSSATFSATIDPTGPKTSYQVEYGPTASYGGTAPASEAVIGSGFEALPVSAHVQDLAAHTTYHFRVVARNEKGTTYGEDRTFTTQLAATAFALPDGRVWEMVTPAEKNGALFFSQNWGQIATGLLLNPLVGEASVNGDAMIDLASAPTEAEPSGYVNEVSVLSTRGPDAGWSSRVLAAPHERATGVSLSEGGEYEFFSEDLSRAVIDPFGPFTSLSPEASEPTPYLRTDYLGGNVSERCESDCYRPLVTAANTQSGVKFGGEVTPGLGCKFLCGPSFVDATPDASHVVINADVENANVQLTSTPVESESGGERRYYEWGDGQLQPLYLLPEDEGGNGVAAGGLSSATHQLSEDGSVFFAYNGHLYLHDFAKDESVRLDVARGVVEPAAGGASFLYAASDGSRVLFSDSQQLTAATGGGIYECRIVEAAGAPGCELTLTKLAGGRLIGGSKDASYLYLEDAGGHLVVDHYDGGEWTVTSGPFVGTWPESGASVAGFGNKVSVSEVSPDGRWLTFMSEEELTGYDNHDAVSGRPDVEVYLYEAASNKLVCASCDPTGARPVGVEYNQYQLVAGSLRAGHWVAANLPPWTKSTPTESRYQPRFLSDSGRLFFDSRDALAPQDVNGTQDVYEYEPPGVGDCTTASAGFSGGSDGCVGLISSGSSAEESAFMDASEGGGDVFFITLSKLVSQDFDKALDVYDAHECTSASPCAPPPATIPPVCSTGDACKAAPTPQPSIFGAPSSATFSGAGNVSPSGSPSVAKAPKSKPLSRSQKLARALKVCAKERRAQRTTCVRSARKRYGKAANHGKKG
jgi:DNA-binding beta-propeller fold protein YncE